MPCDRTSPRAPKNARTGAGVGGIPRPPRNGNHQVPGPTRDPQAAQKLAFGRSAAPQWGHASGSRGVVAGGPGGIAEKGGAVARWGGPALAGRVNARFIPSARSPQTRTRPAQQIPVHVGERLGIAAMTPMNIPPTMTAAATPTDRLTFVISAPCGSRSHAIGPGHGEPPS